MRFGVPRSESPSPVRGKRQSRSTFGLQPDSDDDSDSDSDSESSLYSDSADAPKLPPKPRRSLRSTGELQYIEDTVTAIRLRTRHHDPYEDWERQTRMDAFRTARKDLHTIQTRFYDQQDSVRRAEADRRAAGHANQMKEVQTRLEQMQMKFQVEEERVRENYKLREKKIWDQLENVIKMEEDKEQARLEAERKVWEEAERKRNEEERKRKEDEDRKKAEEDRRKQEEEKKRKDEEEVKRKEEEKKKKELEEDQELLKQEQLRVQREESDKEQRKALGFSMTTDDWSSARTLLKDVKQTMKAVKANTQAKSEWSKGRRQFTSKIGQITDSESEISRISTQLYQVVHPPGAPAHPPPIFQALLSSLSKAILLQAETEVTAEKKSAKPLAQVAFNLLDTIDGFAEVFFCKLVQRVGGWPIPIVVPPRDMDSRPWESAVARNKAMGYRYKPGARDQDEIESGTDYATRIYGIMRVYFQILKITPRRQPLKPMFQLPRYWMWVSRMLGQRELLGTAIAAQIIYIALEVLGSHARDLWGRQWDKMLGLIYEGVTVGVNGGVGNGNNLIGGSSPEGIAARMRVQLEVERIMRGS